MGAENLVPTGIQPADRPTRSESLYWLSYAVPYCGTVLTKTNFNSAAEHNSEEGLKTLRCVSTCKEPSSGNSYPTFCNTAVLQGIELHCCEDSLTFFHKQLQVILQHVQPRLPVAGHTVLSTASSSPAVSDPATASHYAKIDVKQVLILEPILRRTGKCHKMSQNVTKYFYAFTILSYYCLPQSCNGNKFLSVVTVREMVQIRQYLNTISSEILQIRQYLNTIFSEILQIRQYLNSIFSEILQIRQYLNSISSEISVKYSAKNCRTVVFSRFGMNWLGIETRSKADCSCLAQLCLMCLLECFVLIIG